jgi:uncharacterized Zn finger protein
MNELFVIASRKKLRFQTTKGEVSVEDLWDLSLETLDSMAVSIDNKTAVQTKSFIAKKAPKTEDTTRLEILKFIIETKVAEKMHAAELSAKRAQVQTLKTLREQKQMEALNSKSLEDIDAMIASLEA